MTKTTTTICLDFEILQKVKRLNLNLSGSINEYLKTLIAQKDGDIDGINIELERLKRQKNIEKMEILTQKLKINDKNIEIYEKKMLENAEKDLKREKERIESSKKCFNCGKIMEKQEKKNEFKAGFVCHSCFLNSDGADIKRWNQKKGEKDGRK